LIASGAAVALTESAGHVDRKVSGVVTGFVKYTWGSGIGNATATLHGMKNPEEAIKFASIGKTGTFTVTETSSCLIATLNEGSGSATATDSEGSFLLTGRSIQVGGKTMHAGDFVEACAS
jgi:hypothetical protein